MASCGNPPRTEVGLDSAVSTDPRAKEPIRFEHLEYFHKCSGFYAPRGFLALGELENNQASSTGLLVQLRATFLR
jgi:hypothetical protein